MSWVLVLMFIIIFIFVIYIFTIGYPKYGWFKILIHDKLDIHCPDSNYVEYSEDSKIADMYCKYCDKQLRYFNVCKYIVSHKPENIPNVAFDSYCHECQKKNYTRGHDCCPHNCNEISICNYCERDWDNE